MANNLTAVIGADTSQFVEEVKSARNMLNKWTSEVKNSSDTINGATKEQVNAYSRVVKSMEKVASGSMTTTQQQKALATQIRELRIQWANLSEEAKNGDFGKSISSSLRTAQEKAKMLNAQLSQTSDKLKNTSTSTEDTNSKLSGLADKFGINIGMLTKFAGAIGIATSAYDILNTAISTNESYTDEWGRTINTAKDLYSSFVISLNNSDFSSFLSNIRNIVRAAREAYDAIDDLQTKSGKISRKEAWVNAELAKNRKVLRDKNATQEQKNQAKTNINNLQGKLKEGKEETFKLNSEAIKASVNKLLTDNGVTAASVGKKQYEKIYKDVITSIYDTNKKLGEITITKTKKNVDALGNYHGVLKTQQKINLNDVVTDEFYESIDGMVKAAWGAREQMYSSEMTNNRYTQKDITTSHSSNSNQTVSTSNDPVIGSLAELKNNVSKFVKDYENGKLSITPQEYRTKLSELKKSVEDKELELGITTSADTQFQQDLSTRVNSYKAGINNIESLLSDNQTTLVEAEEDKKRLLEELHQFLKQNWSKLTQQNKTDFKNLGILPSEKSSKYNKLMDDIYTISKEEAGDTTNVLDVFSKNWGMMLQDNVTKYADGNNKIVDEAGWNKFKSDWRDATSYIIDKIIKDNIKKSTSSDYDDNNAEHKKMYKDMYEKSGFATYTLDDEDTYNYKKQQYNEATTKVQEITTMLVLDKDFTTKEAQKLIDKINSYLESLGIKPIQIDVDAEHTAAQLSKVSSSIGAFGDALSGIGSAFELPELDAAGLLAGAIASIIQGYGTATAQASSMGPWGWISFALAGLSTVATVIGQINSMKFAQGGIIDGATSVGDFNLARVNGGEMILNGTQQSRLFNILDGGMINPIGEQGFAGTSVKVAGSDLYLALRNYQKTSPNKKLL